MRTALTVMLDRCGALKHLTLALLLVACAGDGESVNQGRFSFAWQVTANGQVIDCATVGIETIRVVTDNGSLTTETFLCTDGEAVTGPRDIGPYAVTVDALGGADALVATSSDQGSILGGQTVDLGVFPLETVEAVCDASSCATGCCDDQGACVDPQTDAACGRGGVTCVDCTAIEQGCNTTDGVCTN